MLKYLSLLVDSFFIDSGSQKFIGFNFKRWKKAIYNTSASEVLVELYPIAQTNLAFSYFANILAEKHSSILLSFTSSNRNSFLHTIRYRKTYEIYKSFNIKSHVNTKSLNNSKVKAICIEILKNVKTKLDILGIVIDDYPIGNDIYEAYLINKVKPTIDIESPDFKQFLEECVGLFYFWLDYFETHNVKAIIMSHGIYKYGIITRIAMKKGIPVYLPNIRAMNCLKNIGELGNPEFHLYPEQFNNLPADIRKNGIHWAKQQLQRRLSGEVGVDMSYATASAFDRKGYSGKVLRESERLKVLITTHCFFDNPNAYGRNLFPDFYEWLTFLGEMSNKTDYDWYLKTHPDVLPGNEVVINEVLHKFPKVTRVPGSVSHHQLAEEGISIVLTVYGSVGHECPLLGEIVINAGMNPHIAYDFNLHPKSLEEYENILLNLKEVHIDIDKNKIYEFYFIHYKLNVCQKLFLNSYSDFMSKLSVDEQNSSKAYEYFLNEYTSEMDTSICKKISTFIDSGKYKYFEDEIKVDVI